MENPALEDGIMTILATADAPVSRAEFAEQLEADGIGCSMGDLLVRLAHLADTNTIELVDSKPLPGWIMRP